jgi:hypothetical protein
MRKTSEIIKRKREAQISAHAHYLDYLNNYLTVELFAEHRGWSDDYAIEIIKKGRLAHRAACPNAGRIMTDQEWFSA